MAEQFYQDKINIYKFIFSTEEIFVKGNMMKMFTLYLKMIFNILKVYIFPHHQMIKKINSIFFYVWKMIFS